MALIEVWVRNDLRRTPGVEPRYERIAGWEDPRPATLLERAEGLFRMLTVGEILLDEPELSWRAIWDQHRRGFGFGVGDVLVIDGRALRCEASGFTNVEHPGSPAR